MSYLRFPLDHMNHDYYYRDVRRNSLNFESVGGERHFTHDRAARVLGRLFHFPAWASRHNAPTEEKCPA